MSQKASGYSPHLFPILLLGVTLFMFVVLFAPSFLAAVKLNQGYILLTNMALGDDKMTEYQLDTAESHFQCALTCRPLDWRAYAGSGLLANLRKDAQDTIEQWDRAIQLRPNDQLLTYWLGTACEKNGEHTRAVELLRQAKAEVKLTTDGDYLKRAGKLQEAQASYQLALEVNPDWEPATQGLGRVLRRLAWRYQAEGDNERGTLLLAEAAGISPRPGDFTALGNAARQAGEPSQARYWYKRGLAVFPEDPALNYWLGWIALQEGDWKQAKDQLFFVLFLDPKYVQAYQLLGVTWLKEGRLQEAERVILSGLYLDNTREWSYARLGDVYMRQGHIDAAKAAYQQALELSPDMDYAQKQLQALEVHQP